jgi:ATP-dependent protease ClpP protease subunit
MEVSVEIQQRQTKDLPGARRVIIESGGGSVDSGYRIIKTLEAEHVPLVCVVLHAAHSMAFNILSHCTVRLATEDATFVVHKVAKGGIPDGVRLTALNARRLADELEKVDEPLSEYNARAMHLNMKDYSKFADAERRWTAQELLSMHYLDGYATL